jgi:hypothetical protein
MAGEGDILTLIGTCSSPTWMNADFAGPSRTGFSSPLSVVRLHGRFANPLMRPAVSEKGNRETKNEHWRRSGVKDSTPCETDLSVFEHAR